MVEDNPTTADPFPRRFAETQRFTLGAPRGFRISNDGERIAFLRSTSSTDPINQLWTIDLSQPGVALAEDLAADPTALLQASGTDALTETDEERARRERAREAGSGIVRFDATADLNHAVFALGGRIFFTDLKAGTSDELPNWPGGFDPRLSPSGQHVAYVSNGAIRLISTRAISADDDRRLIGVEGSDPVTWGVADFIAAEEMGRSRGYWWGPTDAHLLATRVDNSAVAEWTIASPVDPGAPVRTVRYPAAGTSNPIVDLFVVPTGIGSEETGERRLTEPLSIDWQQGEFEYLASVSWGSRDQPTLLVQTRDQRTSAVLTIDPTFGSVTEVHRWTDEHWIENIAGTPAWHHDQLVTVQDADDSRRLCVDGTPVSPLDLQVMSVQSVANGHAIVSATTESTENHVYAINLTTGTAEQLSPEPGSHAIAVGGSARAQGAAAGRGRPTSVMVSGTLNHFGTTATLDDGRIITSHAESPTVLPMPQFVRVGRRELRSALLLPTNSATGPLPVLLDPYGGPHARRVIKSRNAFLTSQWFADQGFAVIVTDGRGTPARGSSFERSVWGDLAQPVLDDQIEALHAMSTIADLDLTRVAIRGWSFGGYLAALAVLRAPDVFHAAVAGAPVTDWALYDTHYTERYLGHPETAPENYARTNLVSEASSLTRPLMLIHGLADDNVVAAHTLALSRALLEAGRPHQVLPLSGVTHMTPQHAVAENLLRLQLDFIRRSLGLTG